MYVCVKLKFPSDQLLGSNIAGCEQAAVKTKIEP